MVRAGSEATREPVTVDLGLARAAAASGQSTWRSSVIESAHDSDEGREGLARGAEAGGAPHAPRNLPIGRLRVG